MLFSSLVFLWLFLPLVLILYRLLPAPCKNALLLAASLLFYAWGEPKYILLMLGSITLNYLGGLLLARLRGRAKTAALVSPSRQKQFRQAYRPALGPTRWAVRQNLPARPKTAPPAAH